MQHLYHVSEASDIEVFQPRMPSTDSAVPQFPVVWAVDFSHLPNYLVPRDCPRVTFHRTNASSRQDEDRLLGCGGASHVVAIESAWYDRAVGSTIWVYEFSPEPFACADSTAGYYVSPVAVVPVCRRQVKNPIAELVHMGVELRVVPTLVALAKEVASSSLAYSCIRMQNASANPNAL
jgi:hypothetical protein